MVHDLVHPGSLVHVRSDDLVAQGVESSKREDDVASCDLGARQRVIDVANEGIDILHRGAHVVERSAVWGIGGADQRPSSPRDHEHVTTAAGNDRGTLARGGKCERELPHQRSCDDVDAL
jgi:hypothetical protein